MNRYIAVITIDWKLGGSLLGGSLNDQGMHSWPWHTSLIYLRFVVSGGRWNKYCTALYAGRWRTRAVQMQHIF